MSDDKRWHLGTPPDADPSREDDSILAPAAVDPVGPIDPVETARRREEDARLEFMDADDREAWRPIPTANPKGSGYGDDIYRLPPPPPRPRTRWLGMVIAVALVAIAIALALALTR